MFHLLGWRPNVLQDVVLDVLDAHQNLFTSGVVVQIDFNLNGLAASARTLDHLGHVLANVECVKT